MHKGGQARKLPSLQRLQGIPCRVPLYDSVDGEMRTSICLLISDGEPKIPPESNSGDQRVLLGYL